MHVRPYVRVSPYISFALRVPALAYLSSGWYLSACTYACAFVCTSPSTRVSVVQTINTSNVHMFLSAYFCQPIHREIIENQLLLSSVHRTYIRAQNTTSQTCFQSFVLHIIRSPPSAAGLSLSLSLSLSRQPARPLAPRSPNQRTAPTARKLSEEYLTFREIFPPPPPPPLASHSPPPPPPTAVRSVQCSIEAAVE